MTGHAPATPRASSDRGPRAIWQTARTQTNSVPAAVRSVASYVGLRVISALIGAVPLPLAFALARLIGRIWWSSPRHRQRALDNLRPALGDVHSEAELVRIGRASCEHFVQVYLVEMTQTPRLVNEWSWSKYVRWDDLAPALRLLLQPGPVIMVTPHFGNYELLGYTLARLGLPLTAVFRPLDDPLLTDYLIRTRASGGLSLLIKHGAMEGAPRLLQAGGTLCFIADQDAGRKGVFAEFFHRPASWYKSIALLAMQYQAPVIAGYAARVGPFRYEIVVEDIIRPADWASVEDPVRYITQRYAQAFERGIRKHPEQYLWVHRRWKTQPRERAPA